MKFFPGFKRSLAVGVIGVAGVAAMGGAAFAAGSSATTPTTAPSTTTPSTTRTAAGAHHRRSLLARADKATVEVKVKGQWVTYSIDRGKVSAVSPTSISLSLADGQTVTESIAASTKFRGVATAAAVTVGKPAVIVSDGTTALHIAQKPATAAPAAA